MGAKKMNWDYNNYVETKNFMSYWVEGKKVYKTIKPIYLSAVDREYCLH